MTGTRSTCNRKRIQDFAQHDLSEAELQELEQHLSGCEQCQTWFDEALSSLSAYQSASALLAEPSSMSSGGAILPLDAATKEGMENLARKLFPHPLNSELLGQIGSFDLVEPIGSGGMGLVYKAFDRELHRYVAIKVLSPSLSVNGAAKQRFIREAQAAAAIRSPHVVPIYSVATAHDIPYLVMSYVPGVNLQQYLQSHGPLSVVAALKVASQVAAGLVAAHERGVVHRDVKPGNVLIEPTVMQATLTDFGLARVADDASLTLSGMLAGTPNYMSPEQAAGKTADARSDWYSLGCVLFALLTGHPPFRAVHAYAVLQQVAQALPPKVSDLRSESPPWLDRLVDWLLQKDPERRLGDGGQIVELLEQCVLHLEQPATHGVPRELLTRGRKGAAWGWPAVCAIGGSVVLASLLVWAAISERYANAPPEQPGDAMSQSPATAESQTSPDIAAEVDEASDAELVLTAEQRQHIGKLLQWPDELEVQRSMEQLQQQMRSSELRP